MITFFSVSLIGILSFLFFFRDGLILDHIGIHVGNPFSRTVEVPSDFSKKDNNGNDTPDPLDIVQTARGEVERRTSYKSTYYDGGYPPEEEGVCTDVIWRGFHGADINLKDLMDKDIAQNVKLYPRVEGNPDPNIDFRRVPNQDVFFKRFAESLTTELIPHDVENLKSWQPGDIVVFLGGEYDHVGIVSDRRAKDGTPYIIHNTYPFAAEVKLSSYQSPITGHYRWKY
nr:DUF1287 domain-containing protein [Bacillus tianshenii]